MNFSRFFSLGVKSTLLTVVLLTATASLVWIINWRAAMTLKLHERQDLADETRQRAWEMLDRVDLFRREIFQLSEALRANGVLDDPAAAAAILKQYKHPNAREENRYLRMEIWKARPRDGKLFVQYGEKPLADDGHARLNPHDPARVRFIRDEMSSGQSRVVMSSQVDWQPYKLLEADAEGINDGFFSLWAGVRLDDPPGAGEDGPDEVRLLVVALLLDDALKAIAESPRHIGFLWDVHHEQLVLSPFGVGQARSAARPAKDAAAASAASNAESPSAAGLPTLEMQIGRPFHQPLRFEPSNEWQTKRLLSGITASQKIKLRPEDALHFAESSNLFPGEAQDFMLRLATGNPQERARFAALRKGLREMNAQLVADDWRNLPRTNSLGFARISQLSPEYPRLRVLASSKIALSDIQKRVTQRVTELCNDLGLPKPGLGWSNTVECRTCDLSTVGLALNSPQDGRPEFIVGRAAFREEQAASLAPEFETSKWILGFWLVLAICLTVLLTSFITEPLKRITRVAKRIRQTTFKPEDSTDAWDLQVSALAAELPLKRRDEIGTLAAAFGQMIQDVLDNQKSLRGLNRDLESRVMRRTQALTSANDSLESANHDLQAKKQELEEAQQRQKMFVFAISHDLKNPLSSVKTTCELLQHSQPLSEEQQDDLQTLYSQVCRLERLIKDILDYQKLGLGELELDPREFSLANLIGDIEKAFGSVARKNGNTLVVECEPSLPPMLSDPDRIKQILENLLSNACKFTRNGRVSLVVRRTVEDGRDWIHLQVADTGGGIKPADQHKIFTPFPRLSKKSENPDGTGLGLSNCRGYCQALGGGISFTSEVGQGTTFFVRLPLMVDKSLWRPAPAKPRPLNQANGHPVKGHKTVLVIDDEEEVGIAMKKRLEGLGFEVLLAECGQDGLELARTRQPGLITLDAIMPGEDGWTVLQRLKSDPLTSEIPVVMITVLNDKFKGFTLGASDYVTKPIDWDLLVRKLRAFHPHEMQGPILIVDDEPEIRSRIIPNLTEMGWRVVTADDGKQALAQVERARPSIILLDLLMPEMDGFEFLERLRAEPQWSDIPVIVTTAKDLSQAERELLSGRVDQIITKDACSWELLEQEITRISRKHDELARMEISK